MYAVPIYYEEMVSECGLLLFKKYFFLMQIFKLRPMTQITNLIISIIAQLGMTEAMIKNTRPAAMFKNSQF